VGGVTDTIPASTLVARRRLATLETAIVAAIAAGAWVGTFILSRGMASMTGTMGLAAWEFVPAWTLMMAAMMLPAVGVTGSMYARTIVANRPARLSGFVGGYLVVWAAAGVPALGLASLAGRLASAHPGAAHVTAVATFAVCGIYQLTGLKDRCLARCRSPFSLLMGYGSYRGKLRDFRVGLHHGGYCLACCWALMVLLIAVGVMNLFAMVGIATLVVVEKLWVRGPAAGRLAGLALLALAATAIWIPSLAPGLHTGSMGHMTMSR
jgi:predicted metal-binding membrane protein